MQNGFSSGNILNNLFESWHRIFSSLHHFCDISHDRNVLLFDLNRSMVCSHGLYEQAWDGLVFGQLRDFHGFVGQGDSDFVFIFYIGKGGFGDC